VAVAVFCALLGFVLWGRRGPAPDESPQALGVTMYEAQADDVVAVELQPQGVRLEREGAAAPWRLAGLPQARVDEARARLLLLAVAGLKAERKLADTADPATYGLQDPQYTVSVFLKDGSTRVFEVGDAAPVGGLFYARVAGGSAVYTLGDHIVAQVRQSAADLRSHSVAGFTIEDVGSFDLYRDGACVLSAKRIETPTSGAPSPARPGTEVTGAWDLTRPWAGPAEGWAVEDLVRGYLSLEVERFETDAPTAADLERCGLTAPGLRMDLGLKGQPPVSVMIGSTTPDGVTYAMTSRGPTVYAARASMALEAEPGTLVLTRPLAFDRAALDGVTVVTGQIDAAAAQSALAAAGPTAGFTAGSAALGTGALRPSGGRQVDLAPAKDAWPADADAVLAAMSAFAVTGAAPDDATAAIGAIAGKIDAVLVEARVKGFGEPFRLLAVKLSDESWCGVMTGCGTAVTIDAQTMDDLRQAAGAAK
jgi:hypothetical protein